MFNSIPLVFLSIFVPIPSYFQDYNSIIEFEVRDGDSSGRCFVKQGCILSLLFCNIKLRTVLSSYVKKCAEIFMGIALSLYIAFGKIAVVTTLILPIQVKF